MLTVRCHLRKYDQYPAMDFDLACARDFPAVKEFTVRCLSSSNVSNYIEHSGWTPNTSLPGLCGYVGGFYRQRNRNRGDEGLLIVVSEW